MPFEGFQLPCLKGEGGVRVALLIRGAGRGSGRDKDDQELLQRGQPESRPTAHLDSKMRSIFCLFFQNRKTRRALSSLWTPQGVEVSEAGLEC